MPKQIVGVRMDAERIDMIDQIARDSAVTRSEIINAFVELGLQKFGQVKKTYVGVPK